MDATRTEPSRLLIGDLVLDAGKRQISRGGAAVDMPKLSYRLLAALAEAAPNVVTHDELVEQVWPGRVVSPETITQRIKLVRQALGDDAAAPTYIALVRGEGYRLIPTVELLADEPGNITQGLAVELGRRRVVQVALVYAAIAWSFTEVVSFLIEELPVFPIWSKALIAILFVVGFPVAMFLAWQFDIGPGGIKRTQTASTEGRMTIAAAVLLLTGATAGLFYLIYPRIVEQADVDMQAVRALIPPADTVAVLPFENASQNPDDLVIAVGISSELRDQLSGFDELRVAARMSSRAFSTPDVDAIAIAEQLRVAKLIVGRLQREGDQIRVIVQIIDGATGFQMWGNAFVRAAGKGLQTQQAIAKEVVAQLLPELDPSIAPGDIVTASESAHELMLVARYYFQQVQDEPTVNKPLLEKAVDGYRRATVADPNSAVAYSRLGAALLYRGDVEQAREAIDTAMSINPDVSEVQYTRGLYLLSQLQPGAREAYLRAIELDPYNADALSAYGLLAWGQENNVVTTIAFLRRALEVDPRSLARYAQLGNVLGMGGRRDEALELAELILKRFDNPAAYLVMARIYELTGDLDIGIAWALKARQRQPDYQDATWQAAELYARIGDFDSANKLESIEGAFNLLFWNRRYEDLIDLGDYLLLNFSNQRLLWNGLARAHAATGRPDQAIDMLERSGLPDRALVEGPLPSDLEALIIYADALKEAGKIEAAQRHGYQILDHFQRSRANGMDKSWFHDLAISCSLSILDRDDEALGELERVTEGSGMPWYPVIRDQPCFAKYEAEPRYQAVVHWLEDRKAELRERLPATLAEFRLPPP